METLEIFQCCQIGYRRAEHEPASRMTLVPALAYCLSLAIQTLSRFMKHLLPRLATLATWPCYLKSFRGHQTIWPLGAAISGSSLISPKVSAQRSSQRPIPGQATRDQGPGQTMTIAGDRGEVGLLQSCRDNPLPFAGHVLEMLCSTQHPF